MTQGIGRLGAAVGDLLNWRSAMDGFPLSLQVPDAAGDYVVRYVQGSRARVLAYRPLTVTEAEAALAAPSQVDAGGGFEVHWSGPDNDGDYLSIAAPDAPGNRYETYTWARSGSPARLTAPDTPGTYELRYVQGQSRHILARRDLTVRPVEASLDAPDSAPSGSAIEVVWTGPDNDGDYVSIASPEAPGNRYETYAWTRSGSPTRLNVPDVPGTYEVRYVQGQSRTLLARSPLTVTPVTATVDAPASIRVNSTFEVTWSGPDNEGDYLSIATPDSAGNEYESYRYTRQGRPVSFTAPAEAGTYEIRYIQGGSRTILFASPLEVVEAD